jgi:ATP-dependent DNA helicase RecQ
VGSTGGREPAHGDARLLRQLRATFGYPAFRPLQREIVEATLGGRDVLALMPTGGGKSLCYQLPALLRPGVTLVVSPLIALMKDQVDKLCALGVAAGFINSTQTAEEVAAQQAAVVHGQLRLLYVAPERLMAPAFLRLLRTAHLASFAIDEAHCISEWGHDFRPEYRELARLRDLFPTTPIAAFTATATARVQADIESQLRLRDVARFRGSFDRANLYYQVLPKIDAYRQLTGYLRRRGRGAGIVYCLARNTTEAVAARLQADGFRAVAYHAGLEAEERRTGQEAFINGDVDIVVATIAFGMGIDKPDVRFVVHYDLPRNLEGYYQESGRAGRDGEPSDCILLYSAGDAAKHEFFIRQRASERERRTGREQLRQMVAWAESGACRRRALLKYFDEELRVEHERCCDVCLRRARSSAPDTVMADVSEPARLLLTCVQQLRGGYGAAYIIRVLRGSRDERILRASHDRLPIYGKGAGRRRPEWHALLQALVEQGYLLVALDEFRVVRLTDRGRRALLGNEPIRVPLDEGLPLDPVSSDGAGVAAGDLFERLRRLRKRLADERQQAAFIIFSDATLRQMASRRPRTRAELLSIPGVGERKVADFGDLFLLEIAREPRGGRGRARTVRDHGGRAPGARDRGRRGRGPGPAR